MRPRVETMEEVFELPYEAFEMRTGENIAPEGHDQGPPPPDLSGSKVSPFDMPGYTPEKKRPVRLKKGDKMYEWVMEKVDLKSSELLDPEKV